MTEIENQLAELVLQLKTKLTEKSAPVAEEKIVEEVPVVEEPVAADEPIELEPTSEDLEKKLYRTGPTIMKSNPADNLKQLDSALRELNPLAPRVRFSSHLEMEQKFHSELNGPDGGYLVVPEFVSRVLENVTAISPVRQLASVMTISSSSVIIPRMTTKLTAYNVGESDALTESQMKFGQVTINLRQMGAQAIFTRQILRDPAVDILSLMSSKATEAFAYKEGIDFISGTGVNSPEGILSAAGVGSVTSASSGTVVVDDIMNMFKTIPHGYNPVLLMNKNTLISLYQQKASTSGNFLINDNGATPLNFQVGSVAATLMGVPVYIMPALADVAASSKSVILADLKAGYQVVSNGGMEILRDDLTQGANGMVVFNMFSAIGGAVVLPEAFVVLTTKA